MDDQPIPRCGHSDEAIFQCTNCDTNFCLSCQKYHSKPEEHHIVLIPEKRNELMSMVNTAMKQYYLLKEKFSKESQEVLKEDAEGNTLTLWKKTVEVTNNKIKEDKETIKEINKNLIDQAKEISTQYKNLSVDGIKFDLAKVKKYHDKYEETKRSAENALISISVDIKNAAETIVTRIKDRNDKEDIEIDIIRIESTITKLVNSKLEGVERKQYPKDKQFMDDIARKMSELYTVVSREADKLRKDTIKMSAELAELKKNIAVNEKRSSEVIINNKDLEQSTKMFREALENLKENHDKLKEENTKLKSEVENNRKKKEDEEREFKVFQTKNINEKAEYDKIKKVREKTEKELTEIKTKIEDASLKLQGIEEEYASIKKEAEEQQRSKKVKQEQLDIIEKDIASSKQRFDIISEQLEATNDKFKSASEEVNKKIWDMKKEEQKISTALEKIKKDLPEKQKELEKIEKDLESKEQSVKKAQENFKKLKDDFSAIKTDIATNVKEIDEKKEKFKILDTDIKNTIKKVDEKIPQWTSKREQLKTLLDRELKRLNEAPKTVLTEQLTPSVIFTYQGKEEEKMASYTSSDDSATFFESLSSVLRKTKEKIEVPRLMGQNCVHLINMFESRESLTETVNVVLKMERFGFIHITSQYADKEFLKKLEKVEVKSKATLFIASNKNLNQKNASEFEHEKITVKLTE